MNQGLTLETSVFESFTVANLPYQCYTEHFVQAFMCATDRVPLLHVGMFYRSVGVSMSTDVRGTASATFSLIEVIKARFCKTKLTFILMRIYVLFSSISRSRSGLIARIHNLLSVFRRLLYSNWLSSSYLLSGSFVKSPTFPPSLSRRVVFSAAMFLKSGSLKSA